MMTEEQVEQLLEAVRERLKDARAQKMQSSEIGSYDYHARRVDVYQSAEYILLVVLGLKTYPADDVNPE